MTEKLPTIKLKGKDYVQVKDRVLFFNEEYPNGSIRTEVEHKQDGSYAWMKAVVIPDVAISERYFIGRSAGPVDEEKSYEKLETVAVGRALALMGIGILESVASAEEIQKFFRAPTNDKEENITENSETKWATPLCPKCKKMMTVKYSKANNSEFFGCLQYPKCKGTLPIEAATQLVKKAVPQTFDDGAPLPDLPF